jgi:hypothetical protein
VINQGKYWACRMHLELKNALNILVGKDGRDHLISLDIDGRIILKWILKETRYGGLDWVQLTDSPIKVHSAVKPKFETQRWCCSHAKSLHDCNMSI